MFVLCALRQESFAGKEGSVLPVGRVCRIPMGSDGMQGMGRALWVSAGSTGAARFVSVAVCTSQYAATHSLCLPPGPAGRCCCLVLAGNGGAA